MYLKYVSTETVCVVKHQNIYVSVVLKVIYLFIYYLIIHLSVYLFI
jgi:hypothetical protein